ncbi:MAG TPA: hypothetical protein VKE42_09015 [Candidatus Cybelea sp.]|nr:hypothetical protein [Candidatus Cybelea sp.]
MPAPIVDSVMHDKEIVQCLSDGGAASPRESIASGFQKTALTLHSGEAMTVLVGNAACFTRGAAARVFIFERSHGGRYRRVLDSISLPDAVRVNRDGTATLSAHETMDVFMESVYVWNGSAYVLAPTRSMVYDVAVGQRVPYETPVSFAPGSRSATLRGIDAPNFGTRYTFAARKGQHIEVETITHGADAPAFSLWIGDLRVGEGSNGRWAGVMPLDGRLVLAVYAARDDEQRAGHYTIRLTRR